MKEPYQLDLIKSIAAIADKLRSDHILSQPTQYNYLVYSEVTDQGGIADALRMLKIPFELKEFQSDYGMASVDPYFIAFGKDVDILAIHDLTHIMVAAYSERRIRVCLDHDPELCKQITIYPNITWGDWSEPIEPSFIFKLIDLNITKEQLIKAFPIAPEEGDNEDDGPEIFRKDYEDTTIDDVFDGDSSYMWNID